MKYIALLIGPSIPFLIASGQKTMNTTVIILNELADKFLIFEIYSGKN